MTDMRNERGTYSGETLFGYTYGEGVCKVNNINSRSEGIFYKGDGLSKSSESSNSLLVKEVLQEGIVVVS